MISRKNVQDADHSVNLRVTREDNVKVERVGVKRTGFRWFRVGDQRRALVHGNKHLGSIKADKYLVQRGDYWTGYILKSSSIIYFQGHQNIHIFPRDRPKSQPYKKTDKITVSCI